MVAVYNKDVESLAADERIPWDSFQDKRVLVTGATGLVGGLCARTLAYRVGHHDAGIQVILPVRDLEVARKKFLGCANADFVYWDATQDSALLPECDYIIHCACPTDSAFMVEHPVQTIDAIVTGTRSMLELARRCSARMCYVSSMEVYGSGSDETLDEQCGGRLDAMNVRSSYPQAKQLAETLCGAYASQYDTDACVARLAQTFGPGIRNDDRRVFAEFARRCVAGEDIVLLTDGSKSNMYVYTADAVRALLMLVARGEAGAAYNVANPQTFCSVYEMARMVASRFGTSSDVRRVVNPDAARRFATSGRIYMDVTRMREMGWEPEVDLAGMYERLLDSWSEENNE